MVEKRMVLKEYIRIRKRRVEEQQTVTETLRREYLTVADPPAPLYPPARRAGTNARTLRGAKSGRVQWVPRSSPRASYYRHEEQSVADPAPPPRSVADLPQFRALISMLAVLAGLALLYLGWQIVDRFIHLLTLLLFAVLLAFVIGPAVSAPGASRMCRAPSPCSASTG